MIDKNLLNKRQPIEKKCPECGSDMYYETNGTYEGEFCWNEDFGDVDLVTNAPSLSDREIESLVF